VEGTQLDYRVLGSLEVWAGGVERTASQAKQRAVLALLLLDLNRAVSTDHLIELLWPEKPPGRPQTAIQGYVSALRKLLGQSTIETTAAGYVLHAEAEQLDANRFERLMHEGRGALAAGDSEQAARVLSEGLELWRGPALADFTYEGWAQHEIARLEELRLVAREQMIEAQLALGRHAELVGELQTLVDEHPLRERHRGQLMLALYRSGRQAEALDAYQQARSRLVDDLGIDPSPELQALYKQILNQDETLQFKAPPRHSPTNLPAAPNALIGRERELQEIATLLQSDDVRLVTLTGPGGTGKTRLALEVARNMDGDFSSGVFAVPLAAVKRPDLLTPTIAQTLGLREQPGESLLGTLCSYLRDRAVLLLLDNLEQINEAVPDIATLLRSAPDAKVLATSRTPLRLAGEHLYPVPPLELPELEVALDADALSRYDAVRLFVARAQAERPDFTVTDANAAAVAEICVRLDGLPLAIELAAARARVLSPQAILARLDKRLELLTRGSQDLDERQQTLRAAIDWSYDLLPEPERALFTRLGVFVGGCRIDAVQEVCDPDGQLDIDILDGLTSLVEKSLLRQRDDPDSEPRFWMLETIREYALDRGDVDLRRTHFRHFASFAQEADVALRGADQAHWLELVDVEHDNLREALNWALANDPVAGLKLAAGLIHFWYLRGHAAEGRRWYEEGLARAGDDADPATRAAALRGLGVMAESQSDFETAQHCLEQSVGLCRELGDLHGVAVALNNLAAILVQLGRYLDARTLFEESVAVKRELGDERGIALTLSNVAIVASKLDDLDEAARRHEEALVILRKTGPGSTVANSISNLAEVRLLQGDVATARALIEEALAIRERLRERAGTADSLIVRGRVALAEGDAAGAEACFSQSLELSETAGDKEGVVAAAEALADAACARGAAAVAARLRGAASTVREAIGSPASKADERFARPTITAARRALGPAAFDAEWAAGRRAEIEDVLAAALPAPASAL
jgi:predicted ATPase/DNA-binding SARP family transcriptional activator/Tfp pilus assembly protein PilF